jgi:hypothetical protein
VRCALPLERRNVLGNSSFFAVPLFVVFGMKTPQPSADCCAIVGTAMRLRAQGLAEAVDRQFRRSSLRSPSMAASNSPLSTASSVPRTASKALRRRRTSS